MINNYIKSQLRNHLNNLIQYRLFIQAKTTPNPNFLKFYPGGKLVLGDKNHDFPRAQDAQCSPLAAKLFQIDGVARVFYGKDYISISKKEDSQWEQIKPLIYQEIMEQFSLDKNGKEKPIMDENFVEAEDTKINDDDGEVVQMIKEIIATRIRPTVNEDGGDIVYRYFEESSGTVYLYMKGSCAGCPSSEITLKSGIEKMLCHYVAEVRRVEATDYVNE